MQEIIVWLLEADPWVQYRTRLDLLGEPENSPEVLEARQKMFTHPQVQALLKELTNWPGTVLNSHKSASQSFHKLAFIADLGLTRQDPLIPEIAKKVMEHQSEEGPFQLPMNIPKHFGGSGETQYAWALCDAPTSVYALIKFGYGEDETVQKAIKHLTGLVRENGWPCAVSKELGKFRGPGRKDDPCPYPNLIMLKMLAQLPNYKDSRETRTGAECLLSLWSNSRQLHPYMFFMGTDFRKIKAPFIWYDLMHVLDVLSQFGWLKNDERLKDMGMVLKSKAGPDGKYTPESEWTAWKGWDFAQKKQPSPWLTLQALKILKRLEKSS
ncbi:MAG: hypothetical protein ACQCN5_00505 [Candidatus Bathyarchaeia archaeon]|jgi:hypothetical protein